MPLSLLDEESPTVDEEAVPSSLPDCPQRDFDDDTCKTSTSSHVFFYYLYRTPISDHHPTIHQAALVLIELRDLNVDELQVMEQFQAGGCNYTNSFQLVTTGT